MRRSQWLVAASSWLLLLGACGDQPAARSPHAIGPARHAEGSYASVHSAGEAAAHEQQPPEYTAHSQELGTPQAGGALAHRSTGGLSSEQLEARFGKARALSVLSGSGSYYADKFAGRSTASGAPYEPRGFTAAHRSLPFGTILRVTRKDGGQVVYVRVTDRGPFGPRGRILDLSRAAAERLGMIRAGVVKIKVEVLEYGPRKQRRRRR
jgi:rare lipoprotein A